MLSEEMRRLIETHTAGMVATVNADGTPSVSPKATFVVLDARTLAFGNIRSPGTLANLARNPAVEVCFIDVLERKAVRATGRGFAISAGEADEALKAAFAPAWSTYLAHMSDFVRIDLERCELILSPAYDLGIGVEELKRSNLAKLNAL